MEVFELSVRTSSLLIYNMKKFTLIILLLALSMLTACAPTKVTEPTEIKPTTSGSEVP